MLQPVASDAALSLISGVLPMLSMKPERTCMSSPSRPCNASRPDGSSGPALAHLLMMQGQPLDGDDGDGVVELAALHHGVGLGKGQGLHQDILAFGFEF